MKVQKFFFWIATIILIFFLLDKGQNLLIPFILAFLIWYVINALSVVYEFPSYKGYHLPRSIALTLSIFTILIILSSILNLISNNIAQVVEAAPEYQQNLDRLISQGFELFKVEEPPTITQLFSSINFASIISKVAGTLTGFMGSAGLTTVYLIFLFIEQGFFMKKLFALLPDAHRRQEVAKILNRIIHDTNKYVGIKTFVSLLTAMFSYLIMRLVGLDFAEFWALLIFILNFIPNIGSLIATLLPALLSLIQFDTYKMFLLVLGGIFVVQFTVANILEPRLMGQSFNLSPLFILLSLALWGAVWGIAGMFLCVPIMVIGMIILSHFPKTEPIAIVLSRDGKIRKD